MDTASGWSRVKSHVTWAPEGKKVPSMCGGGYLVRNPHKPGIVCTSLTIRVPLCQGYGGIQVKVPCH